MKKEFKLHLSKQNFKFSAAHFLIFDDHSAERLHGHNYQVRVDLTLPDQFDEIDEKGKMGYSIDFHIIKKIIKEQIDQWDEFVLLPEKHPDVVIKKIENPKNYEIKFRDRFYSFPQDEVILLPVSNTSVEQFSYLLAQKILTQLFPFGLKQITLYVEETQGQSASSTLSVN